jgi:ABC-type Fe3+ transport system substrate-binding protein
MIRTLNRTSASLEQLLDTANAENVDLVLTSSPMLLQHLQEHQNWRRSAARRQPANAWCRNPFAPPPWPWRCPGLAC